MSISKREIIFISLFLILLLVPILISPWTIEDFDKKVRVDRPLNVVTENLIKSKKIFIVERLTNNSTLNRKIMQCGVDIAYSLGANKTIVPYVLENGTCYTENGKFPEFYCAKMLELNNLLGGSFYFILDPNTNHSMYEKAIFINPKYAKNCYVVLSKI